MVHKFPHDHSPGADTALMPAQVPANVTETTRIPFLKRRTLLLSGCAAFALYLAMILAWQSWSKADQAGFGGYPDEPAHYVTGLMFHDYLHSGMKQSALSYASRYYMHLPMLGIGHWPPLFYALEGVWMFVVGTTRADVLLLIAIISALLGTTLYMYMTPEFGAPVGLLTGILCLAIPVVRWSSGVIMVDIFAALLVLWAAFAFERFMETERPKYVLLFGLLAALALLAKPSSICLAAMVPLAILMTRRFRLLRNPWLWMSAVIVLAIAMPWYMFTRSLMSFGMESTPWGEHVNEVSPQFFDRTWHELNFLSILALAGVGLWMLRGKSQSRGACLIALIPACFAGVLAGRVGIEARYLLPALIAMLVLAVQAVVWIAARWRPAMLRPGVLAALSVGACTAVYAATTPSSPKMAPSGAVQHLVERTLTEPSSGDRVILVSDASAGGEGKIIAEFAMRSAERPSDLVLRATKLFADVDWNGMSYLCHYNSAEEVLHEMEQLGIQFLIVAAPERSDSRWKHHNLLIEASRTQRGRLELIEKYSDGINGTYEIFRVTASRGYKQFPPVMIQKMREKLGSAYGRDNPQ